MAEDKPVIEVKVASGPEKKDWFEEPARRFTADPNLNTIGGKLFESDESVARSPMVFVTWEPVQQAIDRGIQKSSL